MGGTNAQLPIGRQVSLPGHFDLPVTLESARPLGKGFECRVRRPDGTVQETTISTEEAASLAPEAPPPKTKPAAASDPANRPSLQLQAEIPLGLPGQVELPLAKKHLGQNSAETGRRYARSILKWFFPDGLEGLLPRAWRAFARRCDHHRPAALVLSRTPRPSTPPASASVSFSTSMNR